MSVPIDSGRAHAKNAHTIKNILTTKIEFRLVFYPRLTRAGANNPPKRAAVLQEPNAMSRITVGNTSEVITYNTNMLAVVLNRAHISMRLYTSPFRVHVYSLEHPPENATDIRLVMPPTDKNITRLVYRPA